MSISQKALGSLPVPFVGVLQHVDKFTAGELAEIEWLDRFSVFCMHSVNTATGFMPGVTRIQVAETAIVPVGKVDCPIRASFCVDDPEPTIIGRNHWRCINCPESRGVRVQFAGLHPVDQRHAGDDMALIIRERTAFIDNH